MSIGEKNRFIEIYRPSGEVDSANEPVADPWTLHKTKWAEVKGETGMGNIRSAASAGGINTPLNRYSFRVNYDVSIDNTMQIRDRIGNRFDVVNVLHDHARRVDTWIVADVGGSNG